MLSAHLMLLGLQPRMLNPGRISKLKQISSSMSAKFIFKVRKDKNKIIISVAESDIEVSYHDRRTQNRMANMLQHI